MSASRHITIWCDSKTNCTDWHDAGASNVTDARAKAKQDGWRVDIPSRWLQPANNARLDLCPKHASEVA